MRFLVVSTTGIGDTLMGIPALRALRESFPDSWIDLLVHSKKKELLLGNPHPNRILGYRDNFLYRGLLFLKTFSFAYDSVLVFHANDDLWKILKVVRYGECYNRQKYKDLERRVIPLESFPRHSIQKRMALVERVGGHGSTDFRYEISVPESSVRWAKEKLREEGVGKGVPLVGMQLGSVDLFKCWPVESFVELSRILTAKFGARIYLNATQAEGHLLRRFKDLWQGEGILTAPGIGLSQSAALMQACSLFISPDTGPMHMAIGLGVPLIALFCPTAVEDTGPLDYSKALVIWKEITCAPCLGRKCPENFCLRQISVGEVALEAERILSARSTAFDRRPT
jgi:ADP-heptose:LPS heptosyltransferase